MLTIKQHKTISTETASNYRRKSHNGCTSQLYKKDDSKYTGVI